MGTYNIVLFKKDTRELVASFVFQGECEVGMILKDTTNLEAVVVDDSESYLEDRNGVIYVCRRLHLK